MPPYPRRYGIRQESPCPCGSGYTASPVYDARSIFVFFACKKCDAEKRKAYRPEIFTDPNYETSEDIE